MFSFRKYRFEDHKDKYSDTFLASTFDYPEVNSHLEANQTIYCFWTGNNEMSQSRKECLASMEKNMEVKVELITPQKIDLYVKDGYPIHEAYPYLSLVHKADYLRCYFMHHHGGGYADVKHFQNSWKEPFSALNNQEKWIIGYKEIGRRGVAPVPGALGEDLKKHWKLLVGNGAYICKPYTPFTYDWYHELHRRLDNYYSELKKHPGNTLGDNEGYSIPWTNILGDIFHPLCLKYHDKILHSKKVKPSFKIKYR